jgi:hypothetical protein
MAKAVFSEIISDLRGKIGSHVWSNWRGIPIIKRAPTKMDYAWGSAFNAQHRALIKDCTYRWKKVLAQGQKDGWEEYAQYLATLPTSYVKLSGWKQYGGTMSGFNAYTLTNSFRRSIGKTDFLDDAPLSIESPPQPGFSNLEYISGPPKTLRATVANPAYLPEASFVRAWCRGTQYAHLIIAKYNEITTEPAPDWDVEYEANELPPYATPPWTLRGVETGEIISGKLHINHPAEAGDVTDYYRNVDPTENWTFEIKLQIIATDNDIYCGITRPTTGYNVHRISFSVYPDKVILTCQGYGTQDYVMDTTDAYHTYRIINQGYATKLYVDGVERCSISGGEIGDGGGQIFFPYVGPTDVTELYIDYVRYSLTEAIYPTGQQYSWNKMHYAKGAEADILPDTYKVQLDIIGESGRHSPPSEIKTIKVT